MAADAKMTDITELYLEAKSLLEAGERVMSTDEMTGIQALERKHPTIPMGPGRVERREFEYKRHGTVTLIANLDVAQGQVIAPRWGQLATKQTLSLILSRLWLVPPRSRGGILSPIISIPISPKAW